LREPTIVGEHFFDPMLTHDAEMDPIASGQAGVILEDPAGLQERALRDRQDRQAQLSHRVEELKGDRGNFEGAIAVEDLLQDFGIGAGSGTLTGDGSLQETLAGQPVETLSPRGVHEDVRVDEDHV
jgi:hypothetical protein